MSAFRGGRLACVVACALLLGCASEIYREPTTFTPAHQSGDRLMVITRAVDVNPATGYTRTLKQGSRWKYVGRVPRGRVYAAQDDVFMLEGKHMREAYCVIADDATLVGFYLPVEHAFAAVSPPVQLPIEFK